MKMIFAAQFAGEIAAITEDGGGLSRERVAALDEYQRQPLRESLDEVAVNENRSAATASARPKAAKQA